MARSRANSPAFQIARLDSHHDSSAFCCGTDALDRYLRTQASQDVRRFVAACYVATESDSNRVLAYYTLASACVPIQELPAELARKLPKYSSIPAIRIGRLAVDETMQGRGLAHGLLADAVMRIPSSPAAAFALVVDAKDARAAGFYHRFGFAPLSSNPLSLFLPVATALRILG